MLRDDHLLLSDLLASYFATQAREEYKMECASKDEPRRSYARLATDWNGRYTPFLKAEWRRVLEESRAPGPLHISPERLAFVFFQTSRADRLLRALNMSTVQLDAHLRVEVPPLGNCFFAAAQEARGIAAESLVAADMLEGVVEDVAAHRWLRLAVVHRALLQENVDVLEWAVAHPQPIQMEDGHTATPDDMRTALARWKLDKYWEPVVGTIGQRAFNLLQLHTAELFGRPLCVLALCTDRQVGGQGGSGSDDSSFVQPNKVNYASVFPPGRDAAPPKARASLELFVPVLGMEIRFDAPEEHLRGVFGGLRHQLGKNAFVTISNSYSHYTAYRVAPQLAAAQSVAAAAQLAVSPLTREQIMETLNLRRGPLTVDLDPERFRELDPYDTFDHNLDDFSQSPPAVIWRQGTLTQNGQNAPFVAAAERCDAMKKMEGGEGGNTFGQVQSKVQIEKSMLGKEKENKPKGTIVEASLRRLRLCFSRHFSHFVCASHDLQVAF